MSESKFQFEPTTDAEIVRGLDPVDWVQLRLLARLTPTQRALTSVQIAEFAKSSFRGTLAKRLLNLSPAELNLRALAHFTSVRMTITCGKN